MTVSYPYVMFTHDVRLLTILIFYAVNIVRLLKAKASLTLRRSMKPILYIGFEIIYTVMDVMHKTSQNNYITLHLGLIIKLDRIEVAL